MSATPLATSAPHASRTARTLQLAQVVSSVGDGCFYVTSALFLVRVVGLTEVQVGLGLTVGWAAGSLLGLPLGRLADRVGLRRAAVVLALTTAGALLGLIAAGGPAGFLVAIVGYAVSQSSASSVRQALLVELVPPVDRVGVRARLQALQNAGIGVGAALGGGALALDRPAGYVAVLALDAALFVVAAGVLVRLPAVAGRRPDPALPPGTAGAALRDGRFVALTALTAVLMLYMPLLSVVLPLWIGRATAAPTWVAAALFVFNTVVVVALQVRAARRVTDLASAATSVRRAGVLLAASCLVLSVSALVPGPVAATAVLFAGAGLQVLGEVRLAAGSWEIAFGLGDPARPGEYQGLFGLAVPLARTVGPFALTLLVLGGGAVGWWVLGAAFLGAALAIGLVVRSSVRSRRSDPPTADPFTPTVPAPPGGTS